MVQLNNVAVVTNTPSQIVPYNPKRTSLVIWNNDAASNAYLGSDASMTASNGLPLLPSTGYSFLKGMGDDPRLAFFALGPAAGVEIRWFEMTGE